MRFSEFLNEKKKVKEPDSLDDYQSEFVRLRDIQKVFSKSLPEHYRLQMFVPKRRDPKVVARQQFERRWRETTKELKDSGDLKEEAPPVLSQLTDSPPGDNKPRMGFWTSTAIEKKDGTYTSDWYEFVKRTFPTWQTDYGYLFEVQSSPLIFDLNYADRYYEWALDNNRLSMPERSYFRPYSLDDSRSRFPWDQLSRHFDAAFHAHSWDRDSFTQGWDVESTVWFKTDNLKYKGAVKLWHGFDGDDE
jgi:hypothetical protein